MSNMSTLTSPSLLNPIKSNRIKRPSFSPIKSRQLTPQPRPQSELAHHEPTAANLDCDIATASLDFEEFSFWDVDGKTMRNIGRVHSQALLRYLSETFGICEMQISLPYLILFCENEIPPPEKRPFSIAGAIAVWLKEGDTEPVDIQFGDWGEADRITLENDLSISLQVYQMPKGDTLQRIGTKYFPEASFITFISLSLIVEYSEEDNEAWCRRLEKLPAGFENSGVSLSFTNGPIVKTELKAIEKPRPQNLAVHQEDDTDYIKLHGCFSPGAKLQANSGNQITAGIAVEKELESCLTVAFHCWSEEWKAASENLGDENLFAATQAETLIGYVDQRVGNTDIGLAKLNKGIVFHNRFLDIDTTAKVLLHSDNIDINDEFYIDSFVTGRQRLRCLGVREINGNTRREELKGNTKDLPGPGNYIRLRQGVYSTGSREIHGTPRIRAGVCGSALVRARTAGKNGADVLEHGEVAGFMYWSDLQLKNDVTGSLLCFADSVDALVEDGWAVAKIAEKHEASIEEPGEEAQASKRVGIQEYGYSILSFGIAPKASP